MLLNCTSWLEPLKTRGDLREKHIVSVKNIGLYSRMTSVLNKYLSSFVRCFVCDNPELKWCTALTIQDTIDNSCIISYTQKKLESISSELYYKATGHKEGTIGYHQDKTLTWSTANSAVSSSAHSIGGWVDLRSGVGISDNIRTSCTYRDWEYSLVAQSAV